MTTIVLHTPIKASLDEVFDLSRSIDLHLESAHKSNEKVIGGKSSGLLGPDETVTWQGRHLGLLLSHTSKIISYEKPFHFTDIMVKGNFTYFVHQHFFRKKGSHIEMIDVLKYRVPFGYLGRCLDRWLLKNHLTKFLSQRNAFIKRQAEQKALYS
ncbi:MAG: hypothetical protein Aureis2KO_28710 [Aureisphaera sp.]